MKNLAFIGLAALLFTYFSACEKKIVDENGNYTQNTMNNQVWKSDRGVASFIGDKIGINFAKYKKVEGVWLPWYQLSLACIDKQLGRQTLHYRLPTDPEYDYATNPALASYGVYSQDGDVLCDDFRIYEADSVNNWIEITEEEDDFRHIKGRYSMTLTKWKSCAESEMEDTLVIREGVFELHNLENR